MIERTKQEAIQLANDFAVTVFEHTRGIPREVETGLSLGLRRAAVSIAARTFEGCTRPSPDDCLKFLELAHASASKARAYNRPGFWH
ncbi:MAG: hypothetical protein RL240_4415 [Planctomycetota bacterium]|jgi:four helix bundle protein